MSTSDQLVPMSLKTSIILFFVPSLLMILNVNFIMGIFNNNGVPIFYNYSIIYGIIPLSLLLILSIVLYRREGNQMNWDSFKTRFRLKKLKKSEVLWVIALFIFMLLGTVILKFTSTMIAEVINPPSYWPDEINPLVTTSSSNIPTTFMGENLSGNWMIFLFVLLNIILVSFSEEFLWRGYILPKQELQYGEKAWIIHGFLWTIFHLFTPWNIILLLPGALALSYVAQRLKNNTVVIISHGLVDGLLTIIIILIGILQ